MTHDFNWRHFRGEIILWAVRWCCGYGVSYRDLEEMLEERGVSVDHATMIAGCRPMRRRSKGGCAGTVGQAACRDPGAWTKLASRSKGNGRICTARSTAVATPSTSTCRRPGMQWPPSGSRARRCAPARSGRSFSSSTRTRRDATARPFGR